MLLEKRRIQPSQPSQPSQEADLQGEKCDDSCDGCDGSDDEIHDFSSHALSDEEAELAAQFEYYGATREEADATARRMFQAVPF